MAGLSLCVVLALAVVAGVVLLDGGRREVDTGGVDVARPHPAGAAAVLHAFVAAVEDRDVQAAAALAPAGDGEAAELLAAVARNARLLDLQDVSARYVAEVGTVAADGSWTGAVALTWRLAGLDATAARSDVLVSFATDGAGDRGVAITGFGGEAAPGRRTPLWLHGELDVVRMREARVLVLADRRYGGARATADRVLRGLEVVRRTLPDWTGAVVVEVPAGAAALDEVLGVEPGTYAGVAAVTAPVDASARDDVPVHVFVNPDVSRGLRTVGAQVVMSH